MPIAPLVRLENVTARIEGKTILSGLSFALFSKEHLALIGDNGSGKSTLLRLIQADLHPPQGTPGSIVWNFTGLPEPSPLAAKTAIRTVSPAMQQRYVAAGWKISGLDLILSGLDNSPLLYRIAQTQEINLAVALAEKAGAADLLRRSVHAMSQGGLRLMLILRALVARPKVLLLDEPFEGLDSEARKRVQHAVRLAMAGESTVLITAHRLEDIPDGVHRILRLHHGQLHELSSEEQAEIRTPVLAESFPSIEPGASFCRSTPALTAPVLEVRNADVYIEEKQVLFNVCWKICRGEQWVVSGSNGAGKSTLLRLLYGEEFAAFGGDIIWQGSPRPDLASWRTIAGYVSDRLYDTYGYDLTALEVVVSGLRGTVGLYGEVSEEERAIALDWLRRMRVLQSADSPLYSLSTGLARKVMLARAFASAPALLLLDEPCSGLDPQSRAAVLDAFARMAFKGVQMIYVSHYQKDIPAAFTHELHLHKGCVAYAGPRDRFQRG